MARNMQSYENLQHRIYEGVGEYGIPLLEPTKFEKCEFIGFNYCRTCKEKAGKGVHFFLDDCQFNRLWNQPNRYLPILQQFRYVMTPDFSMYTDFPKIIQIYNHYRKHWIGAYLQENGVDVIPTISWSTPDSYEWCFDGEPTNGTVAVSSVGTQKNKKAKELFIQGYREMVRRLEPEIKLFRFEKSDEFYEELPEEKKAEEEKSVKVVCLPPLKWISSGRSRTLEAPIQAAYLLRPSWHRLQ